MLKTVLTLCRVSNLPTVWMNVLTAALVVGQATSLPLEPGTIVLLMISLSLFYMGGMSFNDYMDRHWDAQHQTFRPIPSGKISATTALGISLVVHPGDRRFLHGLFITRGHRHLRRDSQSDTAKRGRHGIGPLTGLWSHSLYADEGLGHCDLDRRWVTVYLYLACYGRRTL